MELKHAPLPLAALALTDLSFSVMIMPYFPEWRCPWLDAMLAALPFTDSDFLLVFNDCVAFTIWLSACMGTSVSAFL